MIIVKIKAYYRDIGFSIITQPYLLLSSNTAVCPSTVCSCIVWHQWWTTSRSAERYWAEANHFGGGRASGRRTDCQSVFEKYLFLQQFARRCMWSSIYPGTFQICISNSLLSDLPFIIECSRVNWISCKHGCSSNYWIQWTRLQIKLLVGKCYN